MQESGYFGRNLKWTRGGAGATVGEVGGESGTERPESAVSFESMEAKVDSGTRSDVFGSRREAPDGAKNAFSSPLRRAKGAYRHL